MKRKLNWRAFFFALPIFVGTIFLHYMLVFIWQPDWITESTFWGVARTSFFVSAPILVYATIAALFAEVKK